MKMLTNEAVLKRLGLDAIKGVTKATIVLEYPRPKVYLELFMLEPEEDWLGIINSGLSHRTVLKIISTATDYNDALRLTQGLL